MELTIEELEKISVKAANICDVSSDIQKEQSNNCADCPNDIDCSDDYCCDKNG